MYATVYMSAWPDTLVARVEQEMFLGRLTIEESHAALERLVRHVMIKAVFMSAVVDAPDPAELAMWLAWSAPPPCVCCRNNPAAFGMWGTITCHVCKPGGFLMRRPAG